MKDTNMNKQFMPFDIVRYRGDTLPKKMNGDFRKDSIGEVVSTVENSIAIVVEFGGDNYIVHPDNLIHHTFKEKNTGPIVEDRILRKWAVSDEPSKNKNSKEPK